MTACNFHSPWNSNLDRVKPIARWEYVKCAHSGNWEVVETVNKELGVSHVDYVERLENGEVKVVEGYSAKTGPEATSYFLVLLDRMKLKNPPQIALEGLSPKWEMKRQMYEQTEKKKTQKQRRFNKRYVN